MMDYINLLVTWATLGQLSDTINSYTSLPSAEAGQYSGGDNRRDRMHEPYVPTSTPTPPTPWGDTPQGKAQAAALANEEKLRKSLENKVNELEAALKKADKAFEDKLAIVDNKLEQVPIISTVVQEQGNSIDSGIDEDKSLRKKIRDLSDRLDSHDRMNKFICSAFDPAELQGQAKEMYGLICPKVGHDEL